MTDEKNKSEEKTEDKKQTSGDAGSNDAAKSDAGDGVPFWEWIVAALGAAFVLAAIGFLLYQGVTGEKSPPDISVRIESIAPVRNGFLVEFKAANHGSQTAAEVDIEGELKDQKGGAQTSAATIDYLPGHSEKGGGLFFTGDPRGADLQIRARGYEEP